MALLNLHFRSVTLQRSIGLTAILPEPLEDPTPPPYRTLWLLHGLSDDHTTWTRLTSIERYATWRHLAVVMPDADRSFYADTVAGDRYWTFISEELPAAARRMLPLSDRRADNFVAGLSMGGYGAFKLALAHPDRYAAGVSLSGALDLVERPDVGEPVYDATSRAIGPPHEAKGTIADLGWLLAQMGAADKPMPRLWACCGTADFLYDENLAFKAKAEAAGVPIDWRFDEGKAHDWGYWDEAIQWALDWLVGTGSA